MSCLWVRRPHFLPQSSREAKFAHLVYRVNDPAVPIVILVRSSARVCEISLSCLRGFTPTHITPVTSGWS